MEDPEERCFYTTFTLEANSTFGFEVEWANHPIIPRRRAVVITKFKRRCPFRGALNVGDIITHLNDKEVTNPQIFNRKTKHTTTFKKLLLDDEAEVPDPQPQQPVQVHRLGELRRT